MTGGRVLNLLLLFAGCAWQASAADALQLFKNYFVTGDYAVAGVGVRGTGVNGLATATITVSGVPEHADILAAFLYWQTIESTAGEGLLGAAIGYPDLNQPLNSLTTIGKALGGGTPPCWAGGGATGGANGAAHLASYRADVLRFLPINPATGKRWVNRSHTIVLPDSGKGNATPSTAGASLLVVYRTSPTYGDAAAPYRAVVIYDGAYTMNQGTPSMSQNIAGFYQPAFSSPGAKLTHIVGNGQSNFGETLLFNGQQIAVNPFVSAAGPEWDNPTFNVTPGNVSQVTTGVLPASSSFDCLSWSSVVFSTNVQDTDGDGLLDIWESAPFTEISSGLTVDLPSMGADPNTKDIFVQLDYMTGANGHSHLLTQGALDKVAAAFRNAPIAALPRGKPGINIHFDVGPNYQTSPPDPAIIPYQKNGVTLALGGNQIFEPSTCTSSTCLFPNYPGTVGWKTGLRYIKDLHFVTSRRHIFHYGLSAHALGFETSPGSGVPKSISGISGLLDGDFMITLGLWDNQTGTEDMQAATLFHELGHNLALRHAGASQTPNCAPNYQSTMNYLFQVAGLLTSTGTRTLDYSRQKLPNLNEAALSEPAGLGVATLPYQARWYVPFTSSVLSQTLGVTPATRRCNGTPKGLNDDSMVRVDSGTVIGSPMDWNRSGTTDTAPFALDVDYDGTANEPPFSGYNDWANIDLQQVGSRRNVIKLSLDVGKTDLATGDAGLGDAGLGDAGLGDAGLGDAGLGDAGLGDAGLGDAGLGPDLDFETANALGNAPGNLAAKVVVKDIVLTWTPPATGQVTAIKLYRAVGTITETNLPTLLVTLSGNPPANTYTDTTTKNNVSYSYLGVAVTSNNQTSGPSNIVTITR